MQAVECVIYGRKQWRWIAVGFEDESFLNGRTIDPVEYSDDQNDLINEFPDD